MAIPAWNFMLLKDDDLLAGLGQQRTQRQPSDSHSNNRVVVMLGCRGSRSAHSDGWHISSSKTELANERLRAIRAIVVPSGKAARNRTSLRNERLTDMLARIDVAP
jgi:hypothetical protein